MTVIFGEVATAGTTTVTETSAVPPANFSFVGQVYGISTTASYAPPVTISFSYNEADLTQPESELRLFHQEGGSWVDVTNFPVDTVNNIVSGTVNSLSLFGLAQPAQPSPGGGGAPAEPAAPAAPTVSVAYGHLRGRVLSQSGNPIPGTAVRAGTLVVPTEPLTGEFSITNLPTGVYAVYYDAPGYISQTQEATAIYSEMTTDAPTVIMTSETAPAVAGQVVSGIQFSPAAIAGRVVDLRGRPIRNAIVRIDATIIKTNRRGYFRFSQVVPGEYTLHFSARGYASQTRLVDVKSGDNAMPKVVMKRPGLRLGKVSRKIRQQIRAVGALPRTVMRTVEKYRKIMAETLNRLGRPDLVGKVEVTDT